MRTFAFGFALLTLASLPALADETVPGHAIVGRIRAGRALILYDVSPEVRDIVQTHASDADGTQRLERDALRALAKVGPTLTSATSFEVHVNYFRTGDVSPAYGTPAFAGIEPFALLTMSLADLKNDRDKWKEAASVTATGPVPASVDFKVTGKLPPALPPS